MRPNLVTAKALSDKGKASVSDWLGEEMICWSQPQSELSEQLWLVEGMYLSQKREMI